VYDVNSHEIFKKGIRVELSQVTKPKMKNKIPITVIENT
jgi:hypothetical protein